MAFTTRFIGPQALHAALKSEHRIVPVCATWFLPNDPHKRTGRAEYAARRIPGARFFDLDKISDTASPYPHMLPAPSVFASAMRNLGISNEDTVVVYDSAELGIFSAPRVAWTFDVFKHSGRVHILNNFRRWVEEGYPVETGAVPDFPTSEYAAGFDKDKVVSYEEMERLVRDEKEQIIDARPHGRWTGQDPEPRPGLPSGHMPGSINIGYWKVLTEGQTMITDRDKLREIFKAEGVRDESPLVVSCGTGVTAAVVDAALQQAGYETRRIYDGSWTEWAQRAKGPDMIQTS